MGQFLRLIDDNLVYFFVQKVEDPGYRRNQFLNTFPYLLGNRKLESLFGNIPEETTDRLVIAESFGYGEDIVLQTAQGCGSYLRGEAGALALAESRICLTVLERDLNSPASGIDLPCLDEIHPGIGGEQTVPSAMLGTAHEEYPDGF